MIGATFILEHQSRPQIELCRMSPALRLPASLPIVLRFCPQEQALSPYRAYTKTNLNGTRQCEFRGYRGLRALTWSDVP